MPDSSESDDGDAVESLLRELDDRDFETFEPPASIWAGIQSAVRATQPHVDAPTPLGQASDESGAVLSLADRRLPVAVRAAVAATFVAIAVGVIIVTNRRTTQAPTVATAELTFDELAFDPLGVDASATAELIEVDGRYEIRLDDAVLPDPGSADLELWMIAERDDGTFDVRPVSFIDPGSPGAYEVPVGLDPAVYSIVDISVEPRDGDDTHSGRSILRGSLEA